MAGIKYAELLAVANARTNGRFGPGLLDPHGSDGSMLFTSGAMAVLEILASRGVVTDPEQLLDGEDCMKTHMAAHAEELSNAMPLPSCEDLVQELHWQNPGTRDMRQMTGPAKFDGVFVVAVVFFTGWLLKAKIIPQRNAAKAVKVIAHLASTSPEMQKHPDAMAKIQEIFAKKPPKE